MFWWRIVAFEAQFRGVEMAAVGCGIDRREVEAMSRL